MRAEQEAQPIDLEGMEEILKENEIHCEKYN